jgi:hypothetical protein
MNIYKNILKEQERLKLLEFCKTQVKDLGDKFPGLQSPPNLHKNKELKTFLSKIKLIIHGYQIKSCWVNKLTGEDLCWHQHPNVDLSLVYYLKNKSNIGTMFKKSETKVIIKKCPQNSLLTFDSNLIHSSPLHLPEERYSIAIDVIRK